MIEHLISHEIQGRIEPRVSGLLEAVRAAGRVCAPPFGRARSTIREPLLAETGLMNQVQARSSQAHAD